MAGLSCEKSDCCVVIWLLWVSNPPSEQKNTWRLSPNAERTERICATCLSWPPKPVEGKTVINGVAEARAADKTLVSAKELEVIELADWIKETPVSKVSNCCNAWRRAGPCYAHI